MNRQPQAAYTTMPYAAGRRAFRCGPALLVEHIDQTSHRLCELFAKILHHCSR